MKQIKISSSIKVCLLQRMPSSLCLLRTAADSYLGIGPHRQKQTKKPKLCAYIFLSLFMSDEVNSPIKILCAYVCVCICMHECKCLPRPDEGVGSLELEMEVVVSQPVWLLGTELWSSIRAGCTLKHGAVSDLHSLLKPALPQMTVCISLQ